MDLGVPVSWSPVSTPGRRRWPSLRRGGPTPSRSSSPSTGRRNRPWPGPWERFSPQVCGGGGGPHRLSDPDVPGQRFLTVLTERTRSKACMDHNTLFAKTPPGRLFFMAALPGSIGMLASALYQLIDGILVGQVLGGGGLLPPSNLAMPFVIINFALADLIGRGLRRAHLGAAGAAGGGGGGQQHLHLRLSDDRGGGRAGGRPPSFAPPPC